MNLTTRFFSTQRLWQVPILLTSLLFLVGCGTQELNLFTPPATPETSSLDQRGTLRMAHNLGWGGDESADPASGTSYVHISMLVYNRLVKLDAGEDGSLTLDPDLFVEYSGERPHQVRLAGGDASSDSYCFPD